MNWHIIYDNWIMNPVDEGQRETRRKGVCHVFFVFDVFEVL